MPNEIPPPLNVSYCEETDILTIDGLRYAGIVFRTLTLADPGTWLRIQDRTNQTVGVYRPPPETATIFDELTRHDRVLLGGH